MARQHGDFGFPGKLTFNVKVSLARLCHRPSSNAKALWVSHTCGQHVSFCLLTHLAGFGPCSIVSICAQ